MQSPGPTAQEAAEIRESSQLTIALRTQPGQLILQTIEEVLEQKMIDLARVRGDQEAVFSVQREVRGVLDVLDRLGTKSTSGVGRATKLLAGQAMRRV